MLDPRVRTILLDYHAGELSLEQAAQALLQVRRDTGCLDLHVAPNAAVRERELVERYAELVRDTFGA